MLRPLDARLRSRLRSGVAITSPSSLVEELVQNALDAAATRVEVHVDLPRMSFVVLDDGQGIAADDLAKIGQRYMTSKCQSLPEFNANEIKSYGYRGEALASIVNVSKKLQIISRKFKCEGTYSVTFNCGLRSEVSSDCRQLGAKGTCMIIDDFMHNVPVRQRLVDCNLELEALSLSVSGLCLINPSIRITLRDSSNENKRVIVRSTNTKNLDSKEKFAELFGTEWSNRLREFSSDRETLGFSQVSVKGLISIVGHSNRRLQFVYVNKRLVLDTCVHRLVNEKLKQSIMCRAPEDDQSPSKSKRNQMNNQAVFCLFITCPNSDYDISFEPRKTLIHFRDFNTLRELIKGALHKCLKTNHLLPPPKSFDDDTDEDEPGGKELELSGIGLLRTPEEDGKNCLKRQRNEASQEQVMEGDEKGVNGRKARKEAHCNNVEKKGPLKAEEKKETSLNNFLPMIVPEPRSIDGRVGLPVRRDKQESNLPSDKNKLSEVKKTVDTSKLLWQWRRNNCASTVRSEALGWTKANIEGHEVDVHAKSGMVIKKKQKIENVDVIKPSYISDSKNKFNVKKGVLAYMLESAPQPPSILDRVIKKCRLNAMTKPIVSMRSESVATTQKGENQRNQTDDDVAVHSKWLSDKDREHCVSAESDVSIASYKETLVKAWSNPQFGHVKALACNLNKGSSRTGKSDMSEHRFLKGSTFANLRLLNQVDNKFISAVVDSNKDEQQPKLLVVFDQHAVHERIRLESLIQENRPAGGRLVSTRLKRPLRIQLTEEEVRIVMSMDDIDLFGLQVEKQDERTVIVGCVPRCFVRRESASERAKRGSVLIPLVASLLSELAQAKLQLGTSSNTATLPKAVQQVLNSFACRTAIKFGESLTWDECDGLLLQLRSCKAPFQCAHGRPSLAPLMDLNKLTDLMPKAKKTFSVVNIDSAQAKCVD